MLASFAFEAAYPLLFCADFAAAVDDLEVRSTSAARIERKEIGSFRNSFIKDDFGTGDVGF